jgi:ankyrin repeat protein
MKEPELMKMIQAGDVEGLRSALDERPDRALEKDGQGVSLLLQALYQRQPEAAAVFARARGVEALDIHEAAALGETGHVRAILEETPGMLNVYAADGFTPLHLAAFFGRLETARLLLDHGADTHLVSRNPMKVTPLHAAVASRAEEVVAALIEAGADVEARQNNGYTPLMGAASAGIETMVDRLLAARADPSVVSDDGKTAASLARDHGHEAIAARLMEDKR